MLINGALSCWNMKNSPAMWRSTEEPTEWQIVRFRWRQEERRCSETSALHVIHVQPIGDGVSRCVKIRPHWFDIPRVKVNGAYYRDILLLQKNAAGHTSHPPASSSYFSRTVLRHTGLVRRSVFLNARLCFHLAGFMAAEQPRPQSSWL